LAERSPAIKFFIAIVLSLAPALRCTVEVLGKELTVAEEAAQREAAKNRRRRIIFNDDGNVPVFFMASATPDELLSKRTTPLLDTQVDSVFLCTLFGGFGMFTHDTKVGQVFDLNEGNDNTGKNKFAENKVPELLKAGNDPLRIVTDYCHQHGKEAFWSLRMNDTHDGSSAWYGKIWLEANHVKQAHPEWLVGTSNKRPRFGSWTAMDFAHEQVRNLVFQYTQEICQNYDVDGVELDFFRHPVFFKRAAFGEPCNQAERDLMTDLVRRIREMTQREGRKRGRPILLAVRVPDSVEYCQAIGIDLEEWLRRGHIDLLITSGYFQLNPWDYSVSLGHRYGAKVYPSLDEPRVRDPEAQAKRRTPAAYLGRAQNVWDTGADGVYIFNYSDLFTARNELYAKGYRKKFVSRSDMLKRMGSEETLKGLDKTYFASVRGHASAAGHNFPYDRFLNVSTLNPVDPLPLSANKEASLRFWCGEDVSSEEPLPNIDLSLRFNGLAPKDQLDVRLNDMPLKIKTLAESSAAKTAEPIETSRDYHVAPTQLKRGENQLLLTLKPHSDKRRVSWSDMYLNVTHDKATKRE